MLSIAGFFAIITMLQLLSFPGQFAYETRNGQGTQLARWVLTFVVGIWFLFAQFSLIALSRIITLIYRDQLISSKGTRWMDILARLLLAGTLYGVGVTFFVAIQADDPGAVVVVATLTAFTAVLSVIGYFFRYQIIILTDSEKTI